MPPEIALPISKSVPEELTEIPPTFAQLARSWGNRIVSRSEGHSSRDLVARLERYVIPHLGDKPAEEIAPQEIFAVLRSIEGKGFVPLAYQIFRDLRAMYRYAVVAGIASRDPTEVLGTYVRRPDQKTMQRSPTRWQLANCSLQYEITRAEHNQLRDICFD